MTYSIYYTYHDVCGEDVDVLVTCRSFKDLQNHLKCISDLYALTDFSVIKLSDRL